jgi:hypothetical protein
MPALFQKKNENLISVTQLRQCLSQKLFSLFHMLFLDAMTSGYCISIGEILEVKITTLLSLCT